MEQGVTGGKVKNIGFSNFNEDQIKRIKECCTVAPAALQVEIHPFFSQEALVKFAQKEKLAVTAYSPLGSGAEINGVKVIEHPTLVKSADRLKKSPAQVVTAWLLQRGIVV